MFQITRWIVRQILNQHNPHPFLPHKLIARQNGVRCWDHELCTSSKLDENDKEKRFPKTQMQMLVVISKPAREKQPVRATLHLISRQHEKAFREPRVSLIVVSSSTLLKPDRSRPFLNFIQKKKEAGSRVVRLQNTFPHQPHQMPHAKYKKTEICQEGLHKASTPASAS